ncbi:hypothetical protein KUTeg_004173 [Tegillarca granosa]|uniref:Uncharacterized protein n=1 Tax=Tegillarca granosa TaxID=220873 RepID=A0ABQ9FR05_TEGGR|nr:hypothetical protein KUTeg_004173 [Tegillarca granosa]
MNIGNVRRKCNCLSGYTGKDCEINIDDCAQNPCFHGGKCTDLLNDYRCDCPPTYQGKNCETRISPCSLGLCQNGVCVDDYTQDVHLCLCNKGYYYTGRPNTNYGQFSLKRGTKVSPSTTGQIDAPQPIPKAKDCFTYFKNNPQMQKGAKIIHNPSAGNCTLVPSSAGNFAEAADAAFNLYSYIVELHEDNFWTPWYSMNAASSSTGYSDDEKRTRLSDEVLNQCSDYEVRYKCAVYDVYQGGTCQLMNNCASSPCKNGFCQNDIGTFRCLCSGTGYEGSLCQHNIDDCKNNVCSNNSTCVDGVKSYTCSCKPGYTDQYCRTNIDECIGVNCNNGNCVDGIDIDECASEPCMHNGTCETNTVNAYSCKCPNGYTGKNCETIIDYCAVTRCTTGNCIPLFGDFFCKCPLLTYGNTCQNTPDLCSDLNVCLNKGQCKPQIGQQPTCQCNECYDGVNCENNIDDCANKNCVGGTCIDMLNAYYCRCPVDKTGENCDRAVDSNYDLFFYSPERIGYATLPYPLHIDTTEMSVSIWVKFYRKDANGTFLTIFKSQNSNRLEESEPLFAVSGSGLTVYHGNNEYKCGYTFTQPNDGKWHNVVIRWNTAKGWELVLDYVVQSSVTSPYQSKITTYLWVSLGSKYNFQTMTPVKDEGFHGYLSQFNMYNRRLNNQETIDIYHTPTTVFTNLIAGWTDFILHRGIQPIYPSSASRTDCTSASVYKEAPVVKMCPANQYKLTDQRLTSVTWNNPVYEGATQVTSTYDAGESYTLGKHIVTYEFRDSSQNAAFCHFTIYVNNYNCTNYKGPYNGSADCESSNYPYQGCKLTCPANKKIDRYTPNIITCGPTGNFYAMDRNKIMVFPPCGEVKGTAKKRLVVVLSFPKITPTNCEGIKDAFNVLLRQAVQQIDREWSRNMCSISDCSDVIITVTCGTSSNNGRKKRDAHLTSVKITIPNTEPEWTNTANTAVKLPGTDVLTQYALEDLLFNNDNVNGAELDPNGFTVNAEDTCADGQTVIDGSCVLCGPGTFFNRTTKICDFCKIGEYQPADGMFSCTQCQAGKTTETIGTALSTDCKDICIIGSYFNTAADRCELCPVGYHQSKEGQFFCDPCPNGQTTRSTGSNSSAACYDFCPSGKELAPNGSCLPCQVGKFRTAGVQILCEDCPTNLTTLDTGSTKQSDCNIIACPAGYKRVGTDQCEACPIGTYQPEKWQTNCLSCGGSRFRTDQKGSTSKSQCKFFCPSGYQADNGACNPCSLGLYKDNNEDPYGLCKPCGNNLRTNITGATSASDCIIFICDKGEKPNATNSGCIKCPYGTYQPLAEQTDCITCPQTMTSTEQLGSISLSQCKSGCPAGTRRYANDSGCEDCPRGYYQILPYQNNCDMCQGKTYTRNTKSTKAEDCEVYCDSGEEVIDGKCVKCAVGYYKDNTYRLLPYLYHV